MTHKIIIPLLFLILPAFVSASVVINEIAWMGTETSYNDEWIELKNKGKENIDLEGWILKSEDGSPEIELEGEIKANSFYLLERTDDNTTPEKADLIYTGALSNKGENLKLIDSSEKIIDKVLSSDGWMTGDNKTKQTMERNSSWQTSQEPGGTPKSENSRGSGKLAEKSSPQALAEKEPLSAESYPGNIVFTEIMPSPEGPDAEEEWIEIYNKNEFKVNLNLWQIKDKKGSITTFTFPDKTISSGGYLILRRPETKITLNNSGDGLELINPKGKIIDSIDYGKASLGESYSKKDNEWAWTTILTPGSENKLTEDGPRSAESVEDGPLSKSPFKEEPSPEKAKAQVSEDIRNKNSFLIALIVALVSASAVLYIRRSFSI